MSLYDLLSATEEHTSNDNFYLHLHTHYELYMFLEGDAKYIVEENVYSLEPGDIIIIRKNTLHRVYHNSDARYRRIVLSVMPEFFEEEKCPELEAQFLLSTDGLGDKIEAEIAKKSGLYDAFMRMNRYTDGFLNTDTIIAKTILIEILYIINKIDYFSAGDMGDKRLKDIISYINRNFTKQISLEDIEKKFFISKYHLCHIFPKVTGLTVHKYINNKRLAMARDMIKDGLSSGEAAEKSGFNNYSSFYRAYLKEYGQSPQSNKK